VEVVEVAGLGEDAGAGEELEGPGLVVEVVHGGQAQEGGPAGVEVEDGEGGVPAGGAQGGEVVAGAGGDLRLDRGGGGEEAGRASCTGVATLR
jgi:hypothetical protein